jgi:glycosyltransferase involved in cell wall biosynthesis
MSEASPLKQSKSMPRKIRLWAAPSGSLRDKWVTSLLQTRNWVRQASLGEIAWRVLPPFLYTPLWKVTHLYNQKSLAPLQASLEKLLQQHVDAERTLIFPPSLDWNTQLFQRPQQLAIALARQGALVLYTQPKTSTDLRKFQRVENRLYLCSIPVETYWQLEKPTIYLLTWNRQYLRAFNSPKIIYDFVDEIETFYGDYPQMYRDHQKMVRNAELVLTTAQRLYKQVETLRPDALLCPNGVDYDLLVTAHQERQFPPQDLEPILQYRRPIVGYYGALARWFDYDLLRNLAKMRPDLSFVLLGPDYDNSLIPSGILKTENIHWLGVKPYSQIPDYLHYFDVAIIPFQVNKITHSTSPLKLFEYMAGGKPVVITPMQESLRYPGILVAQDVADFASKIDQAMQLKNDPQYLSLIDQVARQNTWDIRARQILDALGK